jgi:hypothetical protein
VTLAYSTYLGGGAGESAVGIAVDSAGAAYLTGNTDSTNFPTQDQLQGDRADTDAFATKLAPDTGGSVALAYSTYLGGGAPDNGSGIAVDSAAAAYLTGDTASTNFPTQDRFQGDRAVEDAFVTKLAQPQPPPPGPEPAPAEPQPEPSKAARTATLEANKSKVKEGKKVTFSGQVDAPQAEAACEANQTVELQRGKGTDLKTFKQVQTDATGAFDAKVKVRKTRTYQADVPETPACTAADSDREKVKAKSADKG